MVYAGGLRVLLLLASLAFALSFQAVRSHRFSAIEVLPSGLRLQRVVQTPTSGIQRFMGAPKVPTMRAYSKKDAPQGTAYYDGSGRGSVLLAVVTAFCLWQFTIPPSFRRAYICSTPTCVEQRSLCGNCVTIREWSNDVVDYYKGGGGIQWDFSIDPRTLEQNQQKWDEMFGKK